MDFILLDNLIDTLKKFVDTYSSTYGLESLYTYLDRYSIQYIGEGEIKGFYTSRYYDIDIDENPMLVTEYNFIVDEDTNFFVTTYYIKQNELYDNELYMYVSENFTNPDIFMKYIEELAKDADIFKYFIF